MYLDHLILISTSNCVNLNVLTHKGGEISYICLQVQNTNKLHIGHLSNTETADQVDDASGETGPKHGVAREPVAHLDGDALSRYGIGVALL